MSGRDFYVIHHDGRWLTLPRVTSILDVIDKSAPMMGWATRVERATFRAALEDILTAPGELTLATLWPKIEAMLTSKRSYIRARDDAANIGRHAHRAIQWHTLNMMGAADGSEPPCPDEASTRAVLAFLDWAQQVKFEPLHAERMVFCPSCACAGTLDALGLVRGKLLVVDYKTGKAVYPEAHLQVRAYRHMAAREGLTTEGGMILRLPKTAEDPDFEAVPAVDIPYRYWIYVSGAWRWQRLMDGEEIGSVDMKRCEVKE